MLQEKRDRLERDRSKEAVLSQQREVAERLKRLEEEEG